MRLNEITNDWIRLPPSHPILAVVEVARRERRRFEQLTRCQNLRIIASEDAEAGWIRFYVACMDHDSRRLLEGCWGE